MTDLFARRFDELNQQLEELQASVTTRRRGHGGGTYEHLESDLLLNWGVKVRSLLGRLGGEASTHLALFAGSESYLGIGDSEGRRLKRMKAVFLAAKEDFEGGYLTSYRTIVQAEVFSSELEQAAELLKTGYATAAAVIAGVVLETTLRDMCSSRDIDHGSLNKMNDDLARAGVYNGNQKKQITSLSAIRNSAAHGKPDEFTADQVRGMIDDVQRFLIAHQ